MTFLHVLILAIVQGLAELLPVSSSAHVIVAAKFLGEDMKTPANTLLLVMLHTGTMFAVIVYFWKQWMRTFFASKAAFTNFAILVVVATVLTGVIGYPIVKVIEHQLGKGLDPKTQKAEIEQIFDRLNFIAPALLAAGVLILVAGVKEQKRNKRDLELDLKQAGIMGAVQGLCLPFRGFSRSGATISAGMLAGGTKARVEAFSFALAVVLTPAVVEREMMRVIQDQHEAGHVDLGQAMVPSLIGMVCAFLAGLVALKWLSQWLEGGRWWIFGVYCLVAGTVVEVLYFMKF